MSDHPLDAGTARDDGEAQATRFYEWEGQPEQGLRKGCVAPWREACSLSLSCVLHRRA